MYAHVRQDLTGFLTHLTLVEDAGRRFFATCEDVSGDRKMREKCEFLRYDADAVTVLQGKWRELGLRVEGDRLTVSLDGKELFSATDRTFAEAGRVGLWTKADSLTHFDDLVARRLR